MISAEKLKALLWKPYMPVVLIVCTGAVFSLAVFALLRGREMDKIRAEFHDAAEDRASITRNEIESNVLMLELLRAFHLGSREVERHEFAKFVEPCFSKVRRLQAMEWVPRVPDAERAEYEDAARRDGLEDFQITEENAEGHMVRASRRDEYFPVSFVEPFEGNEVVLGFDLGSEPARREALDRARDTGEVAASTRVRLVQDTGGPFGLLAVLPIYRKGMPTDTVEDRRENLRGFVLGVFRPADIVEKALACLQPESIDVRLTDESAPPGKCSLYWHWSPARKHAVEPGGGAAECERKGMSYATTLDVGGRRWSILATPTPDFIAVRRTWQPWGMLTAGLMFSGLFAAYLTVGSRQTARIERLVHERTSELQKSEGKYRLLTENLKDVVCAVSLDGTLTYCSPAIKEFAGYEPEEEIGNHFGQYLVKGQDLTNALAMITELASGRTSATIELLFKPKIGGPFPIEVSSAPVIDNDEVVGLQCVVRDVSERKRAEEALREQGVFLEAVLDNIEAGIVACNADGVLTLFNRAAQELCGSPQKPIPAEDWAERHDLYLPDGKTRMQRDEIPLFRALDGECVHGVELMIVPKHGPARSLLASGQPLVGEDGCKRGAVVAMHDVTQRKQAEEALRNKEEQLRQIQKLEAVGQLAGGIAHEFNNLLQAIDGYTNYAMDGLSPEGQPCQDLRQVCRATDRAAKLTRQLLGFSRRQPLERRNIDPNQVVVDLVRMVRPLIGEHIHLESNLDEAAGTVYADPGELQQTLLNLCLNARDAMPSGGALTLRSEAAVLTKEFCEFHSDLSPGRYAVLSVTDTGLGISPEVKPHIFEPFFTTKEVGEGAGLGLSTVYGVVQQHEGAIRVSSQPGEGATFRIYLPVVDVAADVDLPEESVPAPGGEETILVAEDDPMVRDIARRILEKAGYTVVAAADGEEALERFEASRDDIALVLLDAIMPKLTGHEVCVRIRAMKPETKIVFCTGYDPETAQSDFIRRQSLRLIEKPFASEVLLRTVREVLDRGEPCQVVEATS